MSAAPGYRLPVFETIGEGYRFLWGARGDWLNYALGPILLVSLVPTLAGYIAFARMGPDGERMMGPHMAGPFVLLGLLAVIVIIAVFIAFAVAWHRRYLLGPERTSPREMISWSRRHWVFLGRGVLYALLTMAVAFAISFVLAIPAAIIFGATMGQQGGNMPMAGGLGALVAWLATIVIVSILLIGPLLAFPAAAVEDYDFRLSTGWKVARGNRLRMFAVLFLGAGVVPLVVQLAVDFLLAGANLAAFPVSATDAGGTSLTLAFVTSLISQAVYFLGVAVGISLLSIMYRRIRDNVPLPAKAAGSPPGGDGTA